MVKNQNYRKTSISHVIRVTKDEKDTNEIDGRNFCKTDENHHRLDT